MTTMTLPLYIIQTRPTPKSAWKTLRFTRPMPKIEAEQFAAELDEHGSCGPVRVILYKKESK